MGKGNKGKKKDVTAKKADPKVAPKIIPNQSADNSTNSKANRSQDLICSYCGIKYEESRWFVQCDHCDEYVHFECAGIVEVREEDPWSCRVCTSKASDTSKQSISTTQQKDQPKKIAVKADVHANMNPSQQSPQDDEIEIIEQTISENERSVTGHGISSTQVPPTTASRTVSKARSTSTSSSRQQIELQRLEEELKINTELDAETLALKLEAANLKALRKKKFLEEKYKALSTVGGSVVSKCTSGTEKLSYVSDWIENQRRRNVPPKAKSLDEIHLRSIQRFVDKIDLLDFDVSIPVDKREIEKVRSEQGTNLKKICETQEYVDNQVQQYLDWRNSQKFQTDFESKTQGPTNQQFSTIKSTVPENYMPSDQPFGRQQQQNISIAHSTVSTSHFDTHPRSRSTLLNRQLTNVQSYGIQSDQDVLNADSNYVFSRAKHQTNSIVTNSGYINQLYGQASLANKNFVSNSPIMSTRHSVSRISGNQQNNRTWSATNPMLSTQPIISSMENKNINYSGNEFLVSSIGNSINGNQYYEQIYSFNKPVSSSRDQSNFYVSNSNDSSHIQADWNKFTPSTSSPGSANNYTLQSLKIRDPLTQSHIAARHAISKDLPIFSGNPKDWCRFVKRYINSTNMCGYTEDENLERLDKCLQGKARRLVESLLLMPNSVPEIMDTLYEKFGRPELIIKSLLKEVREYPAIKPDKLENLSDYGYMVRNVCNQIEDLGLKNYLVNPELVQEVVDKLPFQTRIDWGRYSENVQIVNLKILADWLHNLSRTINRITIPENLLYTKEQNDVSAGKGEKISASASKDGYVYFHNSQQPSISTEEQSKCLICEKDCDVLENCSKFKGLDVDQRWKSLLNNNLCRKCLKFHKRNCYISKFCGVNGCEFKHHPLLHNEQRHSKERSQQTKGEDKSSIESRNNKITSGSNNTHYVTGGELFRIVPVNLYSNERVVSTYAYLDEGSSFTLLERHLAKELGLSGIPETICMLWTKNVHRQEESEVVNLEIAGNFSEESKEPTLRYPLNSVNVVEELNLPEQTLPLNELKERHEHLRNVPIVGYKNVIPTLLIGIKHAKLAVPIERVEGEDDGPIATKSRLGWSIYGPRSNTSKGYVNIHRVSKCPCHERDDDIHKLIKDHFTVENFGVVASATILDSKENERALKMLEKLTVRKGNRFETGLLWKNDEYELPDSYSMAKKRLLCLENKGSKVIDVINDAVKDYISKGYVHKLTPAELAENRKHIWYLPLFTVVHPKKPEKLRTVFDAAAKVKGVSLNSVLYNGPDLVPSIVDILRRFRENKIAITGDIKEMYHQVMVNKDDKHAQRFLWRNGEFHRDPDIYVMDVLTFGSRSSPCSAQYVKNLNATEFEKEYHRAAIAIRRNTYVDDLMDGESSVKKAIQLIQDIKFVHLQGGFEIRSFKSNSEEVLDGIGEKINNAKVMVDDGSNIERVLGMFWDTKSDSFTFSLKYTKVTTDVLVGKRTPSKRELLKLLMSIFDPLGLLSYYLVHLKIIIQSVWRSNIGWDDALPKHLQSAWNQWIELLKGVGNLKIPRWYFSEMSDSKTNIELHIFVDASEHAYASVAYLKFNTDSGSMCSLVGSKTRVAPLKYMSIPRKELMASVLGTRFSNSIRSGLSTNIHRRVIWSDSRIVLTWLHSEHQKYSQFVGHRVGEILESSELSEWRWVPSEHNVADEATKWSKTPTFVSSDRWFTGPKFLLKPESEWPQQPKTIVKNGTTEEMKLSCAHSGLIIPAIVNPNNFSKWERAVRGIAFAIRWGRKVLSKVRKLPYQREPLTQEELLLAEKLLCRQAQWQGFTEEMITLKRNLIRPDKPSKISKSSPIYDCSPYLDESGILRVEGRIDNARVLSLDARRPIIMPRNHPLTRLLMLNYHRKFLHRNHETAVNELRQRFYIPRIRVAFRSARWSCKLCEIKRSRPHAPKMAVLPAIRFEPGIRPFTYTGIDYFGPMEVVIGRRHEKRWGVLLTCLTIRAVHIEIASSLDTGTCIKVIRNFINFRGTPAEFFSDNGTNFVGADSALKKELEKLDVKELSTAITSCYTKWNFNPPASPHMGGCWERLIRTVKSCLNQSMTTRTPREEDLRSFLLEAMNIVNARPLTYIPVGSSDTEALTPNHFILGSSNGIKPPGKFKNDGPYLREIWKEIQRCADVFWDRFIKEYIPTLTRRSKWFEPVKQLEVGDIVLDIDESNPRNTYPKARVVETIIGSKAQVRRARVQFENGNTLWRPAARLAVLNVIGPNGVDSAETDKYVAPTKEECLDRLATIETGGSNVGATNSGEFPISAPTPNATNTAVSSA